LSISFQGGYYFQRLFYFLWQKRCCTTYRHRPDFDRFLDPLRTSPPKKVKKSQIVDAPNSKMRKLIVPKKCTKSIKHTKKKTDEEKQKNLNRDDLFSPLTWAQRLKRVFNIDITVCPVCSSTLRIIAEITDPDIIQKILHHMRGPPRRIGIIPILKIFAVINPAVCRTVDHWLFRH
jgi:hypothetical protein